MTEMTVPSHVPAERVYDLDIYNDERLLRDCHGTYADLQKKLPRVFYTPRNGGHWVVTGYDEMYGIITDPAHFSSREMQMPRVPDPPIFIPLNIDPPHSVPYRQLIMPAFSPKAVRQLDERMQFHAKRIIGSVAGRGQCEFVKEVAALFPVTVFMEFMGFPLDRLEDFRDKADAFFYANGDEAAVARTVGAIVDEMAQLIELRRRQPKQDLLTHLVNARIEGRPLTMDELTGMCMLLFVGGLDTVTNHLSFGTRLLAQMPAVQDRLIADPELVPAFVEESVRMFGVSNIPRIVNRDCERFGVQFREGDMVLNVLTLAGWDERHNANPAEFDLDRSQRTSLLFGSGPHLCAGHFLARAEERVFYTEWMRQIGHFRCADDYQPKYRAGTVMALESLELRWDPTTTA